MPIEEKTIFPEVPTAEAQGYDRITNDFMQLIDESWTQSLAHHDNCRFLRDEKNRAANTDDPTASNKRTNPALLHNSIQKLVEQMDKPAFQMFASEASENVRATMQGLSEDILLHAGWDRVLTNKKTGGQRRMLETGDSIIGYSSSLDGDFPLEYYNEDIYRYFFNPNALLIRNPGDEDEVRKRALVKEYQWEHAVSIYPELAGNAELGAIPAWGDADSYKFKDLQERLVKERKIQIAECRDIDYKAKDKKKGLFTMIAGANKFRFNTLEGANYPDKDKFDNPILPEGQLMCFPSSQGFWNYGFLQLLYKIGVMHSKLLNMGITYTLANSNPVRVVATNLDETTFAKRMGKAMQNGAEGKLPIMVASDGGDFGGVSTTATNPIINEANIVLEILEKQLGQMGVALNNIMTDNTKTLGALQLEVAASAGPLKYIQTTNASEYTFLIENGLNTLAQRKADDSKYNLVSSVKIKKDDGMEEDVLGVPKKDTKGELMLDSKGKVQIFRSFNLEDFKEMWNAYDWKVIVSGGVINNPVLEDSLDRSIQASFPGSKAAMKAAASMYQRHGRNYEMNDFGAPAQPTAPQAHAQNATDLPI